MPDEESACPALSDVPLSDVPLSDVPLPDALLPDALLPDVLPLAWLPEDVRSLPRDEDSEADDSPPDESRRTGICRIVLCNRRGFTVTGRGGCSIVRWASVTPM